MWTEGDFVPVVVVPVNVVLDESSGQAILKQTRR